MFGKVGFHICTRSRALCLKVGKSLHFAVERMSLPFTRKLRLTGRSGRFQARGKRAERAVETACLGVPIADDGGLRVDHLGIAPRGWSGQGIDGTMAKDVLGGGVQEAGVQLDRDVVGDARVFPGVARDRLKDGREVVREDGRRVVERLLV